MKLWDEYTPAVNPQPELPPQPQVPQQAVPWSAPAMEPVAQPQQPWSAPAQPQAPVAPIEMLPRHPYLALRKAANTQGAALLIYHVIMTAAVAIVVFAVSFALAFAAGPSDPTEDVEAITQVVMEASGWGYLLAVAIGSLILLLWKKPVYIRHTILQKGRSITPGGFLALLCVMMSAQLVAQICNLGLVWLMDSMGLDGSALQQLGDVDTDSLPMFLYVGILAPITEELLFRGLLLRSIEPYGKKLAVIGSALLFGLYHGSPVQTPYAIFVGLVLGYVAMEYHVIWAIAMHMFNNLVFALLLPKALSFLPVAVVDGIMWALVIAFFLAAVVIVIVKRAQVAAIWKQETVQPWQSRAFYGSATVVVLMVVCLINLVATTLLLLA